MTKDELLKQSLYNIAKFDVETPNYLKYNKLLWTDIMALDMDAVEQAIIQLLHASHDDVRSEGLTRECNK